MLYNIQSNGKDKAVSSGPLLRLCGKFKLERDCITWTLIRLSDLWEAKNDPIFYDTVLIVYIKQEIQKNIFLLIFISIY